METYYSYSDSTTSALRPGAQARPSLLTVACCCFPKTSPFLRFLGLPNPNSCAPVGADPCPGAHPPWISARPSLRLYQRSMYGEDGPGAWQPPGRLEADRAFVFPRLLDVALIAKSLTPSKSWPASTSLTRSLRLPSPCDLRRSLLGHEATFYRGKAWLWTMR